MKKVLILNIIVIFILLTSCKDMSTEVNNKAPDNSVSITEETKDIETDQEEQSEDLSKASKENESIVDEELNKEISIDLYFPNDTCEKLVPEKRLLNNDLEMIVNAIIGDKKSFMPEGIKLNGITVKGKTAYVDMNKEFSNLTGSCQTLICTQTIVSTLCLNKDLMIDDVQFLIDGKIVETIDQLIANEPMKPDPGLGTN